MKKAFVYLFVLFCSTSYGQNWIDTTYNVSTVMDVEFGVVTGFAGGQDTLKMDISYPQFDLTPECGRPLMVIVHGGAWITGDKNQGYPVFLREDFAQRGYVTASVDYRLGQFNTNQAINCNVPDWNCYNMTDSSEFYRANYRGIQDVRGAIRYLVNHADEYQIDPNNVFVVGESAGGFIAMGVGFIDDESEVLESLIGEYPDAPAPNVLYEGACIQTYGMANSISSMDLSRPALGDIDGILNQPVQQEYTIQGVGNIYGGAFNNVFQAFNDSPPSLYMYHQPCDLIVPFNYNKLLNGYAYCMTLFPAFCGNIINRPYVYGSQGIKNLIDTLSFNSVPTSDYYFDNSGNNYDCVQQFDPNYACHALDNYWLRTTNMASYFANYVDSCSGNSISITAPVQRSVVKSIYPNPTNDLLNIEFNKTVNQLSIEIINVLGEVEEDILLSNKITTTLNIANLPKGFYFLVFSIDGIQDVKTIVKL